MSDERLKNFVLSLADRDDTLSEEAKLVVLAALEGADDLTEVLEQSATRPELVESLTTAHEDTTEPVGAYLRSITVQGFRGIGPEVTLNFQPGPGLTVVAGRNGCGKSTLAEGLELALTGKNSRWGDKPGVWSQSWRNLHAGEPAQVRVVLAEKARAQPQSEWIGQPVTTSTSMIARAGCSGPNASGKTSACWGGPARWRCTGRC